MIVALHLGGLKVRSGRQRPQAIGVLPVPKTNHERQRRTVDGWRLAALRPLFRYSYGRDAYVLRIGGRRFGPVLERQRAR